MKVLCQCAVILSFAFLVNANPACQDKRASLLQRISPIPSFIPDCDEHGNYLVIQCHGSIGQCWCVDKQTGEELRGTRKGQGDGKPNCNLQPSGACQDKRASLLQKKSPIPSFIPDCDE